MLLVIHNLPSDIRLFDIKYLIKEKSGLDEVILDNLIDEGQHKRVTVGLAEEGDAAHLVRNINGLYMNGTQLYVEDVRQKKLAEQPYRPVDNPHTIQPRPEKARFREAEQEIIQPMVPPPMMSVPMAYSNLPFYMSPVQTAYTNIENQAQFYQQSTYQKQQSNVYQQVQQPNVHQQGQWDPGALTAYPDKTNYSSRRGNRQDASYSPKRDDESHWRDNRNPAKSSKKERSNRRSPECNRERFDDSNYQSQKSRQYEYDSRSRHLDREFPREQVIFTRRNNKKWPQRSRIDRSPPRSRSPPRRRSVPRDRSPPQDRSFQNRNSRDISRKNQNSSNIDKHRPLDRRDERRGFNQVETHRDYEQHEKYRGYDECEDNGQYKQPEVAPEYVEYNVQQESHGYDPQQESHGYDTHGYDLDKQSQGYDSGNLEKNKPYSEDSGNFGKKLPYSKNSSNFGNKRPYSKDSGNFGNKSPYSGESGNFGKKRPYSEDSGNFGNKTPYSEIPKSSATTTYGNNPNNSTFSVSNANIFDKFPRKNQNFSASIFDKLPRRNESATHLMDRNSSPKRLRLDQEAVPRVHTNSPNGTDSRPDPKKNVPLRKLVARHNTWRTQMAAILGKHILRTAIRGYLSNYNVVYRKIKECILARFDVIFGDTLADSLKHCEASYRARFGEDDDENLYKAVIEKLEREKEEAGEDATGKDDQDTEASNDDVTVVSQEVQPNVAKPGLLLQPPINLLPNPFSRAVRPGINASSSAPRFQAPTAQIRNRPPAPTPQIQNRPPAPTPQIQNRPPAPILQIQNRPPAPIPQIQNRPQAPTPQIQNRPPAPTPQIQNRPPAPTPQIQNRPPAPTPQIQNRPPVPSAQIQNIHKTVPPNVLKKNVPPYKRPPPLAQLQKWAAARFENKSVDDPNPSEAAVPAAVVNPKPPGAVTGAFTIPKKGKAVGNKKMCTQQKRIAQMEQREGEHMYPMDMNTQLALDAEMQDLVKVYTTRPISYMDKDEEKIFEKIVKETTSTFNKTIKLHVTKRVLDIRTGLSLRLYTSGKWPNHKLLESNLKKRGAIAVKKCDKMYLILCGTFQVYDKLLASGIIVINNTQIHVKPMNFMGPRQSIREKRRAQKNAPSAMQISGNDSLVIFDDPNFEISESDIEEMHDEDVILVEQQKQEVVVIEDDEAIKGESKTYNIEEEKEEGGKNFVNEDDLDKVEFVQEENDAVTEIDCDKQNELIGNKDTDDKESERIQTEAECIQTEAEGIQSEAESIQTEAECIQTEAECIQKEENNVAEENVDIVEGSDDIVEDDLEDF